MILQIEQILLKLYTDRDTLASSVRFDPFRNLWQPLGPLADKVLLRKVNDINHGFCRD